MSESLVLKQQEQVLTVEQLNPEEKQKVNGILKAIDVQDSQAIIQYGVGAQSSISSFADTILSEVRSKDSGYVGDVLTDLSMKVKDLNVDGLSAGGFLGGLPIIGPLFNKVRRFIARYDKLSVQIDRIVTNLDSARMNLLKDIAMLDGLYEKNAEYQKNLEYYILAGQIKLKELQEVETPRLKALADQSNDPADAQKYNDFLQLVNRFDKKLYDLKLSRVISIQTSPQVRLIQNNNQLLVEKIQSSILNTIPLWKNQIVIAISLFRQKKALELQKEISKTTNELLQKNAELLKQGSIEVARESERGIVEIETLRKVNADLISTIDETLKIQKEGREKRRSAEQELLKLEADLKAKLKNPEAAVN